MYLDSKQANDKASVANLFADNFQKMFSTNQCIGAEDSLPQYDVTLSSIHVTKNEIETSLHWENNVVMWTIRC